MAKSSYSSYIKKSIKNFLKKEALRFILIGIFNTLGSYIVYCFLLLFLDYLLSYTLSLILFIIFSSYLNTSFVFKLKPTINTLISFIILIIIQLIIGGLIVKYAVEVLLIPKIYAPFLSLFFITPFKYFTSKLLKNYIKY